LGGLFLGMSFFLLISALILTALLYALGVQQRAGELGLMLAVGLGRNRVRAQLLIEALAVSVPASAIGALLGLAYAQVLLAGLARYWSGAVGNIPILFHATVSSVATGAFATILCALAVTLLCLWRLMQRPARELLQGDFTQARLSVRSGKFGRIAAVVALIAAALTTLLTFATNAADVSMSFFLSGTLVLLAGILIARDILVRAAFPRVHSIPTPWRLAILNASRRRTRSLGMVATLASGCFLVLAVSSMQKDPAANADEAWSGTGGFSLYAETTTPLIDPNAVSAAVPGLTTVALRVRDGDDASCLNLNHAQTPRILGVNPRAMAALGAFLPTTDDKLWERLDAGGDAIPAFAGDANTAMWGLKKKIGDTIEITDDAGKKTQLKLVGTLPTALSVLQGTVLVSDASFTRLWPSEQGFRAFLIKTPAPPAPESLRQLQAAFSRDGMEVTPTVERMRMFYAVESTYLSMFLALGGLGVLLGATATGIVVMRNVFERRRELALMHALGFARNTVFNLLLREHVLLLLMGMTIGVGAAAVAMAPTVAAAKSGAGTLLQIVVPLGAMLLALLSIWAGLTLALRKTGVSALRAE
ncbi:MAG: ABC transporter permease, partial [Candidatus Hydrogenedentales bacterium]